MNWGFRKTREAIGAPWGWETNDREMPSMDTEVRVRSRGKDRAAFDNPITGPALRDKTNFLNRMRRT